jgi:hypothetical protein
MEKKVIYFEKTGPENTDKLLKIAKERANELGISDLVVATTHGGTALKALDVFASPELNLVAVTISEGYKDRGWCSTEQERRRLEEKGIKVLTATHALGDGVASAFAEKYGWKPLEEVVRDAFYRFGQGMKVCVEVVLMAADAGMISMDGEVMAVGGTSSGADTCIVVKPAYSRKFFDLEIREIVTKPRTNAAES